MRMTITHAAPDDEELAALVVALNDAADESLVRKDEPPVGPWRTSHSRGPHGAPRSWNRVNTGTHDVS